MDVVCRGTAIVTTGMPCLGGVWKFLLMVSFKCCPPQHIQGYWKGIYKDIGRDSNTLAGFEGTRDPPADAGFQLAGGRAQDSNGSCHDLMF